MNEFQSAFSAAERVFRIIDENPESADAKDAIELKNVEGNVELRHVDFSYVPGTPILKDINIKAQAGKTIAIVGPTGAGKTTIINLLMRFYDASGPEKYW